ncbi:hypothetical protein EZV62_020820 [Acer yangbiense]|uniref:indole-3-glycerol-phosphate synthase n=1 Tax=Acer yangbiense TaxID=1000413 RepID=A0A5C7HEZ1_9ROSI|nr:hypothetical protein EZV62_020820 [Acer yangbiense]
MATGLQGPIPPELGNTSKLSYLQLQDNQLAGTIPAELGKLEQLFEFTESIETKDESATVSPANGDVETALKVKEWEVGMFHKESEGNTPCNILEEIIWHKDVEVAQLKERRPLFRLKNALDSAPPTKDFVGALRAAHQRTGLPSLIAEVEIAQAYKKGGAACLSVLTDEKYFKGSFENLEAIRNAGVKVCSLSSLTSTVQRIHHLDIKYMIKICKMLGLATLVEVHNEREMDRVLGIEGVELIGINNQTFEVDISNTKKLLEGERGQKIREKDIIVVGESGLFTPDDIAYVQEAGVKAVSFSSTSPLLIETSKLLHIIGH